MFFPGKRPNRRHLYVGIIVSYQRNHRPSTPGRIRTNRVDGYQTNSSTFGTLLSSQGSSAHRNPVSQPVRGQPGETYRSWLAESNRLLGPVPLRRSSLGAGRRPLVRALVPPRQRGLARGVVFPGRPPSLSALRPAARGDMENIMGLFRVRQIESVWSGPLLPLSQVRAGFPVLAPAGERGSLRAEMSGRRTAGVASCSPDGCDGGCVSRQIPTSLAGIQGVRHRCLQADGQRRHHGPAEHRRCPHPRLRL